MKHRGTIDESPGYSHDKMSSLPTNYGSVEASENTAVDQPFDADNAYYLKGSASRLTREQRMRKALLVAVPILAAILIVGGAALFLFRDFNHLYPGQGGSVRDRGGYPRTPGSSTTTTTTKSSDSHSNSFSPPSSSKDKGSASEGLMACSAHPKCASAQLIGDCCPTSLGVMLDCCN